MKFKSLAQQRAVMAKLRSGKLKHWQLRMLKDVGYINKRIYDSYKPKMSPYKVYRIKSQHKVLIAFPKRMPSKKIDQKATKFFTAESEEDIEIQADKIFQRTNQLKRHEKVEDLLETSENLKPLTRQGLKEWQKSIKKNDIVNVDVTNFQKAKDFANLTDYTKKDLLMARAYLKENPYLYKNARNPIKLEKEIAILYNKGIEPDLVDIKSYISKDKDFAESFKDETADYGN